MSKTRKMSNRAMGHLEVILSFVMFIGFVLGLFLAFPITKTNQKTVSLDALERAVANYTRVDVSYVSFSVKKENIQQPCFGIQITLPNKRFIMSSSDYLSSSDYGIYTSPAGKKGVAVKTPSENKDILFYTIYYSNIFSEESEMMGCANLGEGLYTLGLRRNYTGYYEPRIDSTAGDTLKKRYTTAYPQLKKDWGIPSTNDFNIIFSSFDAANDPKLEYNFSQPKTPSRGVYARDIPIMVISKEGRDIKHWIMRLEEW